jgi:cell division transport system permease protein
MYTYTQDLLDAYKKNVNKNYSIIISSIKPIKTKYIHSLIDDVYMVDPIDTKKLTKSFSSTLSKENLRLLEKNIPYFYNITLNYFPKEETLRKIEKSLVGYKTINNVETFSTKHNNFTKMVVLTNGIINFFIFIVFILSAMLIAKQVEVWYFEHLRTMEIMSLFGASLFKKTSNLFSMAIFSSVLSSFIVVSVFYLAHNNEVVKRNIRQMGLYLTDFNLWVTLVESLFSSLLASFVIILFVVFAHKD